MSSPSGSVLASNQRPRLHVAPAASETFGDLAAAFASDYGLTPDPWQQLVLDDWLAEHGGRYAALTCGLSCSRQNGKNGILEVRELFGMVGRGEKILHTAHEVKTARKAFKRLLHFFGRKVDDPGAKFPELNALVTELRQVNGQEAIFLSNGGSVEIVARSQGSGRGFTVDVLVMDEAQDLSDDDLEALMPTTSSAPLGNPQWIFTGTPPGPRAAGEVFTRARAEALSGSSARLCWHEWSVDAADISEIDVDDRELWFATNPALGHRLMLDVIEGERARFSPDGFARERLGWWKPGGQGHVIDPAVWFAMADPTSRPLDPVTFAVDVTPDRASASVAVSARRADGLIHTEVVDSRPGTGWVVDRIVGLTRTWRAGPVRVLSKEPVALDLEQRGVDVKYVAPGEYAQACAGLVDLVAQSGLRWTGAPETVEKLTTAISAARKKAQGDAFTWARKDLTDISPLVAVTLATHGVAATLTGGWMVSVR